MRCRSKLLHALGRGHADEDRFPGTVMHVYSPPPVVDGYILHELDEEALLAVYSKIRRAPTKDHVTEDLGEWASESMHIHGELGNVEFGVAARNGQARPWAQGPVA